VIAEAVLRSLSLCLAGLFLVAIAHKAYLVRAGSASQQPLIRRRGWEGRNARLALAGTAAGEAVIAGMLVVRPTVGFAAAACAIAFYTFELRRLAPDESCGCLGEILEAGGRSAAVRRNLILLGAAGSGGLAYATGAVDVSALSQLTAGVALLVLATTLALTVLLREATLARGE
jgi:hypothetical protein